MIVNVKLPPGKTGFSYGPLGIGTNPDGSVDVPDYAAKALVAAGGICSANLSKTTAQLLAKCDVTETGYMIMAWGQTIGVNPYVVVPEPVEGQPAPEAPVYDQAAHAAAVLAARGEPTGSVI